MVEEILATGGAIIGEVPMALSRRRRTFRAATGSSAVPVLERPV